MGSVYILTNEGMPNLVKIGYTNRTAEDRAKELYKDRNGNSVTGVPAPFDVAYEEFCENPIELETLIHQEFDEFRPNKDREFFTFPDPSEAIQRLKRIHEGHPTHKACVGNRGWRKWTSHFLTRFKRKANTEQEENYERNTLP